jgi:Ca-activated chloride channel family protein
VQGSFRFFWLLLFLPLTFAAQSGQRAGEENSSYRYGVEVDLVSLFATVHDSSGRLVTHLKEGDFILYDDGVRQNISQFSREYLPLSVLILLDTSGSMYGAKLENAKRSLVQFLRRLNRGDEAELIAFQTKPRILQGLTPDLELIRRKLKQLEGNGSTALYDTILYALDQARKSNNRRRALLLISDGINTYGKAQLKDTITQLRRQGVELFAIGMETDQPEEYLHRSITRAVLNSLTESAGGEAFIVREPKELGKVCAMISDRMHNQYTLAYYPPKTNDIRWRTIRVETRVPNLKVIPSKTGYYPFKPAP